MDIFEWEEDIPVTANNLNEMQNILNNNIIEKTNEMGKLLWEGTFSSGSLQVTGISDYIVVAMDVGGVICVGNQQYGGCSFTRYGSLEIDTYAYRFTYNTSNETLTIDNISKGGTNGTSNVPITKIYGIF